VLLILAALFVLFPPVFVYPFAVELVWIALALLYRGIRLRRRRGP